MNYRNFAASLPVIFALAFDARASCDQFSYSTCIDVESSAVTSPDVLRNATTTVNNMLRNRVMAVRKTLRSPIAVSISQSGSSGGPSGRSSGIATGLAAGDGYSQWNVWTAYTRGDQDNDFATTAFDLDLDSVLVGADMMAAENLVAGVTFGYEAHGIDTDFNGGKTETNGYTVAPYAAYQIDAIFSVDVSGGYTNLDTDMSRIQPTTGTPSRGEMDADRWFLSGNLNANYLLDSWVFGARAGYLYSEEEQDGFTETNGNVVAERTIELGQGQFGADVAYNFGPMEPYFTALYRNDFIRDDIRLPVGVAQPDNDDDDFQFGLGFRYFGSSGFTTNLEWLVTAERDDIDENAVNLSVSLGL